MPSVPPDLAAVVGARPFAQRARAIFRALRPYQWSKNVLVFLPIIGAHRVGDTGAISEAALSFVAFGLVASAVYVVNDVADLEADRLHPRKRLRPFAAGELAPSVAFVLAPALLAAAAVVAFPLPRAFLSLLGAYFLLTLAYSFVLKRMPLVDVFVLGALYTTRIFAGAFATEVPVSEWLASFSMFLFVSLGFLKRASELSATDRPVGRGYVAADRDSVFSMGICAGYVSVLVLALYVSSPDVRRLYASHRWLWALCPLVLYWVSHLWLRARRGDVDDDPLMFALRDRSTWAVAVLGSLVVFAATRGWR